MLYSNPETFEPDTVVTQLKAKLEELKYSESTISRLDSVWRNFAQYWNNNPGLGFSVEVMDQFIAHRYGYALGDKDRAHNIRRAMNMLWDFSQFHTVFKQSSLNLDGFSTGFAAAFEGFLSHLVKSGYAEGSIVTFRSRLFQFEAFLLDRGVICVKDIRNEHLTAYTETLKRFSPKTAISKLRLLRQFLDFANNQGYMEDRLTPALPKIRIPQNTSLPNAFTREETQSILAVIDRSNPIGKRNYAIFMLAAGLGLRVSDILNLTFDEIDWPKKTLRIVQGKTGKVVELPLSDEIGWSIIDYLQNGRPQSSSGNVFIKHCAPYDALASSIYGTLQKYLRAAGINRPADKHTGMHAFRHGLASAMLDSGVPLPVISGTLGHSDPHSTERYLSIDLKHLRSCALEVE